MKASRLVRKLLDLIEIRGCDFDVTVQAPRQEPTSKFYWEITHVRVELEPAIVIDPEPKDKK